MKKREPFMVPGAPERRCVCCHADVRGGDYKKLSGRRALCASCERAVLEAAETEARAEHGRREALIRPPSEPVARCRHGVDVRKGCLGCAFERQEAAP